MSSNLALLRRAALGALLVGASAPALHAQNVPGMVDRDWGRQRAEYTADALEAYNEFIADWTGAWKSGDPGRISELYSLAASAVFADGELVRNRDGVRRYLAEHLKPGSELRVAIGDFVAADDLYSGTGAYELHTGEDVSVGTYLLVLRRENGRWRIRSQALIPARAAEEPAAASAP